MTNRIRAGRFALVVALLFSAATAAAQTRSLRILLTNDDGFDSTGLRVMREALIAAGHQVTVVAPATNQSSQGMAMTSGILKYEDKGNRVYAVFGTPADSAMVGLQLIMRDTPVDLVVSGTNAGQNIGASGSHSSGTVNAALYAAFNGVPAIATSAGSGTNAGPAYQVAASVALQIIRGLDASRPAGGRLLPEGVIINVNVPARPAESLLGVRFARLSGKGGFTRQVTATGAPGEVRSQLTVTQVPAGETGTDLAFFSQGYVAVTMIGGDGGLDLTTGAGAALAARMPNLTIQVPATPAQK